MKAVTLLYHDIIKDYNWDSSGFPGVVEARYKMYENDFISHLNAISKSIHSNVILCKDLVQNNKSTNMLAFDDGGSSAVSIADKIEKFGWKGHFLITTSRINSQGFVSSDDIISLDKRGHIIGSHSHTHPKLISGLPYSKMLDEWRTSKEILQDILGKEISVASIPGGFYSKDVAQSASDTGYSYLFTSEPIRKISQINNIKVIGRFTIFDYINSQKAASLASGNHIACLNEWTWWNIKKLAKKSAGPIYFYLRDRTIRKK